MPTGNQTPADIASEYAALAFLVQQKISAIATLTLCRVVSCTNDGGVQPIGTLTVQPLVNIMSGDRVSFPHKPLYNVPYCRVQGGTNAIIIDPQPGDIGLVGFCSRDINAVKTALDKANPGSNRLFSMADGIWIMTCLGVTVPTQYFVANTDGISIVSPTSVTIEAPVINLIGAINQSGGVATFAEEVLVGPDSIGSTTHKHPTAPNGPVSPPIP